MTVTDTRTTDTASTDTPAQPTERSTPPVDQHARLLAPEFLRAGSHLMSIGGREVAAISGGTLTNTDPSTEQALPTIPRGKAEDVDAAVKAARAAFEDPSWKDITPDRRGVILNQIAAVLEQHGEELAAIDSVNMGAPRTLTSSMLAGSAEIFRYFAGWPTKVLGTTVPGPHDRLGYTRKEPLGVVGIIWGWNGPMGQLPSKLAPALAAGNTVVLKPAEAASLSTLRLVQLVIEETDLPAGVLNVVTGMGGEAGEALVAHADVNKISFTGSTAMGKHVQRTAVDTLKKVTLELGGKSPTVVFADADLQAAATGAAAGFLANAGQACVAGSRVLVQESIHDEFVAMLTKAIEGHFQPGDPFTPGTVVGALATKTHFDSVSAYVDSAREEGAEILTGGGRYGDHGYFYAPTLIDKIRPDMKVVREEIFGPVGVLTTFTDLDDAIAQANDTMYGLASSVWTTDLGTAHRMAARIQAGTVWINTWGEQSNSALPFGGYKQSGIGREGGLDVLDAYTQDKSVLIAL